MRSVPSGANRSSISMRVAPRVLERVGQRLEADAQQVMLLGGIGPLPRAGHADVRVGPRVRASSAARGSRARRARSRLSSACDRRSMHRTPRLFQAVAQHLPRDVERLRAPRPARSENSRPPPRAAARCPASPCSTRVVELARDARPLVEHRLVFLPLALGDRAHPQRADARRQRQDRRPSPPCGASSTTAPAASTRTSSGERRNSRNDGADPPGTSTRRSPTAALPGRICVERVVACATSRPASKTVSPTFSTRTRSVGPGQHAEELPLHAHELGVVIGREHVVARRRVSGGRLRRLSADLEAPRCVRIGLPGVTAGKPGGFDQVAGAHGSGSARSRSARRRCRPSHRAR